MIKRLSIFDTDKFMDIVDTVFTREFQYMGKRYGSSRREMQLTYPVMRVLQVLLGDIWGAPDILAYYEDGHVLGITKIIPYNSRKDHWYSEITAVRKDLQKRGVGTALKQYTVAHYSKKARRLFGSVREENTAMLKTNSRVGYRPYMKKVLLTKDAPTTGGEKEIEGFRTFNHDEKGVYDLYTRRTPKDIQKIEDKIPADFGSSILMKLLSVYGRMRGEKTRKFVIERGGKICAYFYFEKLWSHFENLEVLLDPEVFNLSDVTSVLSTVSPDKNILSYVPEYRDFERKTLLHAGFEPKEVYVCMVVESGGG